MSAQDEAVKSRAQWLAELKTGDVVSVWWGSYWEGRRGYIRNAKVRRTPSGRLYLGDERQDWQRGARNVPGAGWRVIGPVPSERMLAGKTVRAGQSGVPIEREPKDFPLSHIQEECCFCRKPTPFWTTLPDRKPGAQVACCEACAEAHRPEQVPTKNEWWDYKKPETKAAPTPLAQVRAALEKAARHGVFNEDERAAAMLALTLVEQRWERARLNVSTMSGTAIETVRGWAKALLKSMDGTP